MIDHTGEVTNVQQSMQFVASVIVEATSRKFADTPFKYRKYSLATLYRKNQKNPFFGAVEVGGLKATNPGG